MKLLSIFEEMKYNNLLLWKGKNYNLLKNYLIKNNIGEFYEPDGDYFEDVIINLMFRLVSIDHQLIVKIDDIIKYPLKKNPDSLSEFNFKKVRIFNLIISNSINVLWISTIVDKSSFISDTSFLKNTETIKYGSSVVYKSNIVLRFDERNNGVDVTLIKHPEIKTIEKWVLNKDFEEVE